MSEQRTDSGGGGDSGGGESGGGGGGDSGGGGGDSSGGGGGGSGESGGESGGRESRPPGSGDSGGGSGGRESRPPESGGSGGGSSGRETRPPETGEGGGGAQAESNNSRETYANRPPETGGREAKASSQGGEADTEAAPKESGSRDQRQPRSSQHEARAAAPPDSKQSEAGPPESSRQAGDEKQPVKPQTEAGDSSGGTDGSSTEAKQAGGAQEAQESGRPQSAKAKNGDIGGSDGGVTPTAPEKTGNAATEEAHSSKDKSSNGGNENGHGDRAARRARAETPPTFSEPGKTGAANEGDLAAAKASDDGEATSESPPLEQQPEVKKPRRETDLPNDATMTDVEAAGVHPEIDRSKWSDADSVEQTMANYNAAHPYTEYTTLGDHQAKHEQGKRVSPETAAYGGPDRARQPEYVKNDDGSKASSEYQPSEAASAELAERQANRDRLDADPTAKTDDKGQESQRIGEVAGRDAIEQHLQTSPEFDGYNIVSRPDPDASPGKGQFDGVYRLENPEAGDQKVVLAEHKYANAPSSSRLTANGRYAQGTPEHTDSTIAAIQESGDKELARELRRMNVRGDLQYFETRTFPGPHSGKPHKTVISEYDGYS